MKLNGINNMESEKLLDSVCLIEWVAKQRQDRQNRNEDTGEMESCHLFEECGAPLCPLSKDLKYHIWYPDEEICRSKRFARLHWVKNQKKIVKLGVDMERGYFTVVILEKLARVSKRVKGINPDKPISKNSMLGLKENNGNKTFSISTMPLFTEK